MKADERIRGVLDLFEEEMAHEEEFIRRNCHAAMALLSPRPHDIEAAMRCAGILGYHDPADSFAGVTDEVPYLPTVAMRDSREVGNHFRPVSFNPAWRTTDVMLRAQGV